MTETKTISFSDELKEKEEIKELVDKNKLSKTIRDLLWENVVGQEAPQNKKNIFEMSDLTDKQIKIVKLLLSKQINEIEFPRLWNQIKNNDIYQREDYIKSAIDGIVEDNYIPFTKEGHTLKIELMDCYCDARIHPFQEKCPQCGVRLIPKGIVGDKNEG